MIQQSAVKDQVLQWLLHYMSAYFSFKMVKTILIDCNTFFQSNKKSLPLTTAFENAWTELRILP